MNNWQFNETKDFLYLKKERRYKVRNHVIVREGDTADKIYIVVEGEVEVVKTDLSQVYYNPNTCVVGMKEKFENKKDGLIKSNCVLTAQEQMIDIGGPGGMSRMV